MRPYWRQTIAVWSIAGCAVACGLAMWRLGIAVSPVGSVMVAYAAILAIAAIWRCVKCWSGSRWPDVAGAQMREVERRRS